MPEFTRRKKLPMRPSSYRAAARSIRRMADQLEARAEADSPRDRASRTSVIHRLVRYARHLQTRNSQ